MSAPLGPGLDRPEFALTGALQAAPEQLNPLLLAFIGDAVCDLQVRLALLAGGHLGNRGLHEAAVDYVRASAQAAAVRRLWDRLTPDEQGIVRRARNARPGHIPRNADPGEYHLATGLEALLGYLFLSGREVRLKEILRLAGLTGDPTAADATMNAAAATGLPPAPDDAKTT